MSGTPVPLAIHPWPLAPEQLELVQRAYLEIAPPFPVQPVKAVPGEPTRVFGMGSVPPFAVETALVRDVTNYEEIRAALRHYLFAPAGSTEGFWTATDFLNVFLGPGVTEIAVERAPQTVRFQ